MSSCCAFHSENMKIEWPAEDDEEEPPPKDAQYLVESLLKQNPDERLGSHTMGGEESYVQLLGVFVWYFLV